MKHLALIFVCIACAGCVSVSAWVRHPIVGRVIDADSGQPVSRARVMTADGELLAMTAEDGRFSAPAKKGKVTVFLLGANDLFYRMELEVSADGYVKEKQELSWAGIVRADDPPSARILGDIRIKKEPKQPSEPTPPTVTDRAGARSAPAGGAAHL